MQKRKIAELARTCVLYGQGAVITYIGSHILPLKRQRVKTKVDAYGNLVYKTKKRVLRPEYNPDFNNALPQSIDALNQKYWDFLAGCRAAYRQAAANDDPILVGNMSFTNEQFIKLYREHRAERRRWKDGYSFSLVRNQVKKMGFTPRKLKKEQKLLIARAFREFSDAEINSMRRRAQWRRTAGLNTKARALYFNEQIDKWKNYFRIRGLQYIGCPKLKPYKGLYNETYWYNFRDKYIPEEAFDFNFFPKPEMP